MNKLSIFLAFVAFAIFSACSNNKEESSGRGELCKTLNPECLVGNWQFEGVWETSSKRSDCFESGDLTLRKEGGFEFTGGIYDRNDNGSWSLDGDQITVLSMELLVTKTGTVKIISSGNNMEITANEDRAVFSDASDCSGQIEKFSYIGPVGPIDP